MTPEERNALQVALTLRYGIKCPTCNECTYAEATLPRAEDRGGHTDPPQEESTKFFCRLLEQRVDSTDLCRNYSPEEWLIYHRKRASNL